MPPKVSVDQIAALITKPFTLAILGRVDDYDAYLSRFEGKHAYHKHPQDELYLVLEGEVYIDYADGRSVLLREKDVLVARAYEVHRSRSEKGALVLMFKARDLPWEAAEGPDL